MILAAMLAWFSAEDLILRRITWPGLIAWWLICIAVYGHALSWSGALLGLGLAVLADFPGGDRKALALIGAVVGWPVIAVAIAMTAGVKVALSLQSRVNVSGWPVLPGVAIIVGGLYVW